MTLTDLQRQQSRRILCSYSSCLLCKYRAGLYLGWMSIDPLSDKLHQRMSLCAALTWKSKETGVLYLGFYRLLWWEQFLLLTPASGQGILIFMTWIVDVDRRAATAEKEPGSWTLWRPFSLNEFKQKQLKHPLLSTCLCELHFAHQETGYVLWFALPDYLPRLCLGF